MLLETHGHCFLCSRKILLRKKSENLSSVSLRAFCRFLDLDVGQMIMGFQEDQKPESDFQALFCFECRKVATSFKDLILQLEVVQMKVGVKLQTFANILDSVNDSKWTDANTATVNIANRLREKIKEKCQSTIEYVKQDQVPQVSLERYDGEQVSKNGRDAESEETDTLGDSENEVEIVEIVDSVENELPVESNSRSSSPDVVSDILVNYVNDLLVEKDSVTSSLDTAFDIPVDPVNVLESFTPSWQEENSPLRAIVKEFCWSEILEGGKRLCGLCNTQYSAYQMSCHVASAHPEQVFKFDQLPSTDDSKFRDTCLKVLRQTCGNPVLQVNAEGFKQNIWPCEYCDKSLSEARYLQHHLLDKLFIPLAEKLRQAQDSHDIAEDGVWNCWMIGCGQRFDQKDKLNNHIKTYHGQNKCPCCPKVCDNLSILKQHTAREHVEQYFVESKSADETDLEFHSRVRAVLKEVIGNCKKLKHSRQCVFCECTYTHKNFNYTMSTHLVNAHHAEILHRLQMGLAEKENNNMDTKTLVEMHYDKLFD